MHQQTILQTEIEQVAPVDSSREWLAGGILLALCLLTFFARLGSFGLVDGVEASTTSAAREMIESGDYLVPQLNYQICFSKPILPYWLTAAGAHLVGVTELAGRIFPALAAVSLSLLSFYVARTLGGLRAGILASLMVAGAPILLQCARISGDDTLYALFMSITAFSLVLLLSANRSYWFAPAYVSLALAVLSEGPAAIAVCAIAAFSYFTLASPGMRAVRMIGERLRPLIGSLLFLAVCLPWFLAVGYLTDWLFLKVFFGYENFSRWSPSASFKPATLWLIAASLLFAFFPWSLLVPAVCIDAVRRLRNRKKLRQLVGPETTELIDARVFLILWSASSVVLFLVRGAQIESFLLPAIAPLAVAVALSLNKWLDYEDKFGADCISNMSKFCGALAIILGGIGMLLAFYLKEVDPWINQAVFAASAIVASGLLIQFILVKSGRAAYGLIGTALSFTLASALIVPAAIEYCYDQTHRDLHDLCAELQEAQGEVGLFMAYRPSTLFYLKRPVNFFFQPQQLVPFVSEVTETGPPIKDAGKAQKPAVPDSTKKPAVEPVQKPAPSQSSSVADKPEAADAPCLEDPTAASPSKSDLLVLSQLSNAGKLAWHPNIKSRLVKKRGDWGIYAIEGATLKRYATLEETFAHLDLKSMVLSRQPFGNLSECLSGGERNLPDRLQ